MATPTKIQPKAVAKSVKPAAKRTSAKVVKTSTTARHTTATDPAEPSVRFHHSKELRSKVNALLLVLETSPNPAAHGSALADLVADLTEAGMDYYFLKALKQAKVGFVAEQSARLGMSGAIKLITSVSRKFIERMDSAQLLVVAQHIRSLY